MSESPFHIGDAVVLGKRRRFQSPVMTVLACWQPPPGPGECRREGSFWLVKAGWFDGGARLQEATLSPEVLMLLPEGD